MISTILIFARAHMNTGDEGFSFARIASWAILCVVFSVLGWAFNKAKNAELEWRRKRAEQKRMDEENEQNEKENGHLAEMHCTFCGKEIGEEFVFCPSCGQRLQNRAHDVAEGPICHQPVAQNGEVSLEHPPVPNISSNHPETPLPENAIFSPPPDPNASVDANEIHSQNDDMLVNNAVGCWTTFGIAFRTIGIPFAIISMIILAVVWPAQFSEDSNRKESSSSNRVLTSGLIKDRDETYASYNQTQRNVNARSMESDFLQMSDEELEQTANGNNSQLNRSNMSDRGLEHIANEANTARPYQSETYIDKNESESDIVGTLQKSGQHGLASENGMLLSVSQEKKAPIKPPSSLRVVAVVGTQEVQNAKIIIDYKEMSLPVIWKTLNAGVHLGPFSIFYSEGEKHYRGNFAGTTVDWDGIKTIRVPLSENTSIKAGTVKTIDLSKDVTMECIWCPPGTFVMGGSRGGVATSFEKRIRLTRGFWLTKFPVTQKQWTSVMKSNPSLHKGDLKPVDSVSWNDCQMFIAKIRDMGKGVFRLPTEAEWEYACRAGTTTDYNWNSDRWVAGMANCNGATQCTAEVGDYKSNQWGFFDMHGNVWEWCSDWYDQGYYHWGRNIDPAGPKDGYMKALRGGSWKNVAADCRSFIRNGLPKDFKGDTVGFRLASDEVVLTTTSEKGAKR